MATFLLFELLNGLRIHPMQYLMVGFAMCLFFQLLLAFSEHVGFVTAYLVAAAATVTTITLYSSTVLRTRRRAAVLGTSLAGLYGVLFVLVQLQTYTLVVGSVALFAVLVAFMYLTRGLDWYRLGRGVSRPAPEGRWSVLGGHGGPPLRRRRRGTTRPCSEPLPGSPSFGERRGLGGGFGRRRRQKGLPRLRKNTGSVSSPGSGSSFQPISRRTGPIGER